MPKSPKHWLDSRAHFNIVQLIIAGINTRPAIEKKTGLNSQTIHNYTLLLEREGIIFAIHQQRKPSVYYATLSPMIFGELAEVQNLIFLLSHIDTQFADIRNDAELIKLIRKNVYLKFEKECKSKFANLLPSTTEYEEELLNKALKFERQKRIRLHRLYSERNALNTLTRLLEKKLDHVQEETRTQNELLLLLELYPRIQASFDESLMQFILAIAKVPKITLRQAARTYLSLVGKHIDLDPALADIDIQQPKTQQLFGIDKIAEPWKEPIREEIAAFCMLSHVLAAEAGTYQLHLKALQKKEKIKKWDLLSREEQAAITTTFRVLQFQEPPLPLARASEAVWKAAKAFYEPNLFLIINKHPEK